MAWFGKTSAEVCQQFKDPARNGKRDVAALVDHILNDKLVAWGWSPGGKREPAPGSALELSDLIKQWGENGSPCPTN
jgi:hypothetical protein